MSRNPLVLIPTRRGKLAAALTLATVSFAPCASAQEVILEEVLVTSQKREQSLQDVPSSVVAISGETLDDLSIENLQDLTSYATNIHLTETGLSTQLRIRGIGSDNSQGFEQSVGVYVDGIFRGRAQLFRAPIFDMERVEIMRGPQGTLFGKNSIAGALDLITAKPTEEFEAEVSLVQALDEDTREVEGFVSGPLTDTVQGRLAARWYDDPGYVENSQLGGTEPERDEKALRGSLAWTPVDNVEVLFTAEHDTFDVKGRAIEITQDLPALAGAPSYSQVLANFTGGTTFESNLDYIRQTNLQDTSDNQVDAYTLRVDYERDGYTFTSLTGALGFDYTEICDCDFTPADVLTVRMDEDYEQVSQEFRLASPTGQNLEWLAGVFYQQFDQRFDDTQGVGSTLPTILRFGNPPLSEAQAMALQGTGMLRNFEQDSEIGALFGQLTWSATDTLRLTLGARYTHEEKNASKVLNIVSVANDNQVIPSAALGALYQGVFLAESEQLAGHDLQDRRSESAFTPSFTTEIDVSENVMAYGKISRGFKAGGFDPRSNNTENFEFEEESVTAYEVGYKTRLAEGRGEINFALFRMDYDNLQISQFDGRVGFNVGNAAETRVQGLELDGRWQLSDHLLARYSGAYLDFEYLDFANGDCYYGQGDFPGDTCDYSGERGAYTPEFTLHAAFDYVRPVGDGLEVTSTLEMQWVDEHQVHVNLDPQGKIDAYTLVTLRLAVGSERWELALLGRNLLDEEIITSSANLPLSELIAGSNSYYSFLRPPRSISAEATYRF